MKYPFFVLFSLSSALIANPTGEQLVHGEAIFLRPSNNELQIHQQNDQAIIEWNDFSIDANELTKFIQPNSDSVMLNRVVGHEISKLYGTLEANGRIVLINPNGVIVGENGVINAAAFLASLYDISNADFLDGKLDVSLTDISGAINVEGRIEATQVERIGGRIFLVADEVHVGGSLYSPGGEIELNGKHLTLGEAGVLDVSAIQDSNGGRAIVYGEKSAIFSGSIYAKGGELGGDGGFIEVSSPRNLELSGNISTIAPKGRTGMFLIDPTNVTIRGAADMNTVGPAYNYTSTPVFIDSALLSGFLNGSSVTIDTSNPVDPGETGPLGISSTADMTS